MLNDKELIDQIAYALHYESWYKGSIEGKFGKETDGYDHGRFRKSKDAVLDTEFFSKMHFDENCLSEEKDEHGSPYYKKEVVDGKTTYFVDSALKGWDFLPPSWKKENQEAAEFVVHLIKLGFQHESMSPFVGFISESIHNEWVARSVSQITGKEKAVCLLTGCLSNGDYEYLSGKNLNEPKEHTMLYDLLVDKLGLEGTKNIWGLDNFREFEELPFEEQIKDTNQILIALGVIKNTENELKSIVETYNHGLVGRSFEDVEKKINSIIETQSYESKKEKED